jgi:thiol-disulfide isomerase/thioredoxin
MGEWNRFPAAAFFSAIRLCYFFIAISRDMKIHSLPYLSGIVHGSPFFEEEKMKRPWWMAVFFLVLILFPPVQEALAGFPYAPGDAMEDLSLPVPGDAESRAYLGLSGRGNFTPADVAAPVLLIQIFSMYCPHCQRDAGNVNVFYGLVDKNPVLRKQIRILGIGAGNSPYEVGVFRESYGVPFPLFGDGDYRIHRKLGEVRTPFYIALKKDEKGVPRIVFARVGGIEKAEDFLAFLIRETGLEVKGP